MTQDTQAYYYSDYVGGGKWRNPGTVECQVVKLKNTSGNEPKNDLLSAVSWLKNILSQDLPSILQKANLTSMTVCVAPRAKEEGFYQPNQKLFKTTIRDCISQLHGFEDGTDYIIRRINTKTTHLRCTTQLNDGSMPYVGITTDTCSISDNVRGKDILLIDDLYTRTVNIDEDVIQALLNKGARSVIFYAVGKTVSRF
ncbi:MAG: phosphoribosyltransferase [Clostridiales bacterium]|nr:phosphoribosyltransferase [Clostridiales bacterium]